jgi:hypothetical protein
LYFSALPLLAFKSPRATTERGELHVAQLVVQVNVERGPVGKSHSAGSLGVEVHQSAAHIGPV